MKKVLIVGSTSIVGRAVGNILAENHSVHYAGRTNAEYHLELNSFKPNLPDNVSFDVVIHVAADFGGDTEADFYRAELVNALGTLSVCRIASKVQAKHLVVVSSISACYQPGDPYFGIYSLSKRHADELAQHYSDQFQLPLTILRPTQLYDSESKCRSHQGLFYSIIDKAERGEDVQFNGGNDAIRNMLFIADFSAIIAKVIELKVFGTFNCPGQNSVRLSEIAKTAYDVFGKRGDIKFLKDKPDILSLLKIADCDIYKKIHFKPAISLEEGIRMIKEVRNIS